MPLLSAGTISTVNRLITILPSAAVGMVETENDTAVDPASDVSSNACTYYNGRRWSEKYGYPVSDTSSLDRSD